MCFSCKTRVAGAAKIAAPTSTTTPRNRVAVTVLCVRCLTRSEEDASQRKKNPLTTGAAGPSLPSPWPASVSISLSAIPKLLHYEHDAFITFSTFRKSQLNSKSFLSTLTQSTLTTNYPFLSLAFSFPQALSLCTPSRQVSSARC